MKNAIFPATIAGVFLLLAAGCHKETPQEKKVATEKTAERARQSYLDWDMKTIVEPYQNAGHSNPNWDNAAKLALTEFARMNSGVATPDEDGSSMISNACVSAMNAGCDDPMVRYLDLRFAMNPSESGSNIAAAYCVDATALESSAYPASRKFWAWRWAQSTVQDTYGWGTNIPKAIFDIGPWARAETIFSNSISDKTVPAEEVYLEADAVLQMWSGDAKEYDLLYDDVEKNVNDDRANTAPLLLLRGAGYVAKAWHARGGGYANTVTAGQWKDFASDLGIAHDAISKAWELDPSDSRIPTEMLRVKVGQGGRPEMEVWFDRAMKLSTNNYNACSIKLQFLEPKWYGSDEDMLAFGRECATNELWGGHVPLILIDAIQEVYSESTDQNLKSNYWSSPQVWADAKSAFDRFFQLNPDEISWYHNYALYAYYAGQWATFNELVPKLGPINYGFFGGKERFDQMVAYSKAMARTQPGKS